MIDENALVWKDPDAKECKDCIYYEPDDFWLNRHGEEFLAHRYAKCTRTPNKYHAEIERDHSCKNGKYFKSSDSEDIFRNIPHNVVRIVEYPDYRRLTHLRELSLFIYQNFGPLAFIGALVLSLYKIFIFG